MMNENLAPVTIPTLCRYEHFKRCIESLSRCTLADKTEVYVALDYPAKESHWDGYNKIKDYLLSHKEDNLGFKKLIVIQRSRNYGLGEEGNIMTLRKEIFSKYDRVISSEDDNEFSPNFLVYMNKGLEKFKDNPDIFAICGFCHGEDLGDYQHNYYVDYETCAWGIAYWKDKYEKFLDFCHKNPARDILLSKKMLTVFKVCKHWILPLLIMNRKRVQWGDYYMGMYCCFNGMVNIHPVIRKVRNWGVDGSGATCNQTDNRFINMKIDQAENFIFDDYHEVKCQEDYIFKCLYPYRNSLSLKSKFKIMVYLGVFSFLLIVDLFDKNRKYPI